MPYRAPGVKIHLNPNKVRSLIDMELILVRDNLFFLSTIAVHELIHINHLFHSFSGRFCRQPFVEEHFAGQSFAK